MSRKDFKSSSKSNRKSGNCSKRSYTKQSYTARNSKPCTNDPAKEDLSKSSSNNPKWYGSDYAILRDSASINYSIPAGSPLTEMKYNTTNRRSKAFPGVLALYTRSAVGYADSPSSPINVASNTIYSYVRHANAGHSNYDAPDLMIYLIAMSQVYSYINFLTRAYALSTLYGQKNRYLPNAIMHSMNIDLEDAQKNGASFRYGINVLINKAASFAVPNTMPYFEREAFLYSGIYTEGTSLKDQMYIINPDAFLQYTIDETDSYGCLDFKTYRTSETKMYTVDELIAFGNELIDPIIRSEDMNIMGGDILKAYGQDNLIKVASVDEKITVLPEFNITVLEQIKNARIIGACDYTAITGVKHAVDQASFNLSPYLVSTPVAMPKGDATLADILYYENPIVLTTTTSEPDVDVTIENTRFAVPFEKDAEGNCLVYAASDYVVSAFVYTAMKDNTDGTFAFGRTSFNFVNVTNASSSPTQLELMLLRNALSSHFDFMPMYYEEIAYTTGSTSPTVYDSNLVGDTDNFALVDAPTMKRMNEAALLNLLHVETIAKLG